MVTFGMSDEHEEIKYYLDDIAKSLADQYDPSSITGPHNLTGNNVDECAVFPFLLTAYNTGKFWGFDFDGYKKVVDFFSNVRDAKVHMSFARAKVKGPQDLDDLATVGHLRRVMHETTPVYFVSETLAATATNRRRPLLVQ